MQHHYGSMLSFGPDGNIYMTNGDHAQSPFSGLSSPSQNISSDGGCVIRIRPDGSFPPGNIARGWYVLYHPWDKIY